MEALMSDLVTAMRLAIDEVKHDDLNDIFDDDSDNQMMQAIETAAQQILLQAQIELLEPQRVQVSLNALGAQDYDAIQTQYTDGHGSLVIPDDWLRLVALRLKSWPTTLTSLMEPDSREAQMQACRWTRGTPQKPKGMITVSPTTGKRVLMYWTAGRYEANHAEETGKVYDHAVDLYTYIPFQKVEDGKLILPMREEGKKLIVYRAISIFLVSKKEAELAEKFKQLSEI